MLFVDIPFGILFAAYILSQTSENLYNIDVTKNLVFCNNPPNNQKRKWIRQVGQKSPLIGKNHKKL